MRTRPKVLLTVSISLFVLFLYLFLTLSTLLSRNYTDFERNILKEDVLRTRDALDARREDLSLKLGDWAQWDDTYEFAADGNQDYLDSNLQNEAFELLRVNLIVITGRNNETLFAENIKGGEKAQFPESLSKILASPEYFPLELTRDSFRSGVLSLPEGDVVFASRPITSSDGSAEPNGRIFFGYFLDSGHSAALSALTHLDIDIYRYAATPSQAVRDGVTSDSVYISPVNGEAAFISGFTLVHDALTGEPAIVLAVEIPRDIYFQGQRSINLFLRTLVIAGTVITLAVLALFELIVLRKLSRLDSAIAAIAQSGDSSMRLEANGHDEFGQLSQEINRMLESLEDLSKRQAASDSQLRLIADITSLMIWMSGPDGKATYFNKGWTDFVGGTLEESLNEGWVKYFHPDDLEPMRQATSRAIEAREPFQVEYRLRRSDGEYRWILASGKPYFHGEQFQGYIGSGLDITERKIGEDQNRVGREEAEKMNQLMVARELRMVELKEQVKKLQAELDQQPGPKNGSVEKKA